MVKTRSNRGNTFSVNTIPGTSSKKILKTDDQIHSSTNAVLGNDDLLIEILLQLPVLSLHLFKLVSKHWLSVITSPNFTLRRKNIPKIEPPAGLLIFRETYEKNTSQIHIDFESFDIRIPSKRSIDFTLGLNAPPGFVYIFQSCNGLLLCGIYPCELFVCNPTTKLFKRLVSTNLDVGSVRMIFDPTKSPHYKVIHVIRDDNDDGYCQIETYSSETGNWTLCGDRFTQHSFSEFDNAIYWNDALHWLITDEDEDEDEDGYLYCNLKIVNELPVFSTKEVSLPYDVNLLESRGSLLLLTRDETALRKFNVHEMKNGSSERSVKYIVDLNELSSRFPFHCPWRTDCHVWAIVLGEREEDSFMIIDLLSKVVQYNPMLKTLRTLYISGLTRSSFMHAYQFIPSFAGV